MESGFEVIVSDTLESYSDTDLMTGLDLIVQCWTMGEILPDEIHGLRAAVQSGTGFAGWHGGMIDSLRPSAECSGLVDPEARAPATRTPR